MSVVPATARSEKSVESRGPRNCGSLGQCGRRAHDLDLKPEPELALKTTARSLPHSTRMPQTPLQQVLLTTPHAG